MNKLSKHEGTLLEIKAKAESLDVLRKKLKAIEARRLGTFRQVDTYFKVPEGRLKLRETEGKRKAELIYYEREDVPGPKRSKVFILELQEPGFFKTFLERVLEKKVVVDKKREIYRYKGTQVHLDTVKELGTFIEFERRTAGSPESICKDRKTLRDLMKTVGVKTKDLLRDSYSDLVSRPI